MRVLKPLLTSAMAGATCAALALGASWWAANTPVVNEDLPAGGIRQGDKVVTLPNDNLLNKTIGDVSKWVTNLQL